MYYIYTGCCLYLFDLLLFCFFSSCCCYFFLLCYYPIFCWLYVCIEEKETILFFICRMCGLLLFDGSFISFFISIVAIENKRVKATNPPLVYMALVLHNSTSATLWKLVNTGNRFALIFAMFDIWVCKFFFSVVAAVFNFFFQKRNKINNEGGIH